jgi:phenylacetic acid degradation operon negative regulatory protein
VSALTLTQLAELFDVPEPTTRVTISRLKNEGWLASHRKGRLSYYSPTAKLTNLVEGSQGRILERRTQPWDQRWDMVLYTIPETDRGRRELLRSKLEWLGYGQFAPGCWISPHRRNCEVLPALANDAQFFATDEIEMFEMSTTGPDRDAAIARRCWELDELNAEYEDFDARRRDQLATIRRGGISDIDAFVERVLLIAEYRKFPFRDPDLPTELLPRDWIGRSAHSTFLELREL